MSRGPLRANLTDGPIAPTLLAFTLPVLGGNVLQSLNGSVNAMWIGRGLGEAALSAASNANVILFFLLGVVFGISMANTILVGQSVGARDLEAARRITGTGAVFFIGLSVAVAVGGFVFTPAILAAMGTPPEATAYAEAYLRIIFVALPVMYFLNFVMMSLRGAGDSRTPFWFMLLSVVLDIVLNPLLIFGFGPVPALGIAGSALATLIAQTVSLSGLLAYLYHRHHFLALRGEALRYLRPDPAVLKALVLKGLPMGLQMVVISSSGLIMFSLVNHFGTRTTAAYGVVSQLWSYLQMPALAIGAGVSSMTAHNVGAGRWDRVGRIAGAGIVFNLAMTGLLVGVLTVFDRQAVGLFLAADSGSVDIARHINAMVTWSWILFGITIVLFSVVRATGAVIAPLVVLVVSMWLIRLPFAAVMSHTHGAEALWWSFPLGSGIALTLAAAYYRLGRWRRAAMMPGLAHGRPAGGTDAAEATEATKRPPA